MPTLAPQSTLLTTMEATQHGEPARDGRAPRGDDQRARALGRTTYRTPCKDPQPYDTAALGVLACFLATDPGLAK